MKKTAAPFIADVELIDIAELELALSAKKKLARKKSRFVSLPMERVAKLQCRGMYIFLTLCVLTLIGKTVWKSVKKEQRPWFFVADKFRDQYAIPKKSWYESINKLIDYGIIQKRSRVGAHGRNLYAFADMLEEGGEV